jgi:hypothetical protein
MHQEQGCKRIAIIRPELQDTKSFFFTSICNYARVLNLYNKNNTYRIKESSSSSSSSSSMVLQLW